jgi:hypothetical protein
LKPSNAKTFKPKSIGCLEKRRIMASISTGEALP